MIGRGAILAVMALGVGATALPQLDDRPPWLVWNASASVPIGLYAVDTIIGVHAGDLVVVRPPEPLARFLADRGYLPRGVPLLKHVAASPDKRSVASAAASLSTRSKWAMPASAMAAAARSLSGRAAASSQQATSS